MFIEFLKSEACEAPVLPIFRDQQKRQIPSPNIAVWFRRFVHLLPVMNAKSFQVARDGRKVDGVPKKRPKEVHIEILQLAAHGRC